MSDMVDVDWPATLRGLAREHGVGDTAILCAAAANAFEALSNPASPPTAPSPDLLVSAFRHALTFKHNDPVYVKSGRYTGPGTVTRQTHWESHIIVLHHETEVHVAVLLENGNIWFYPALDVRHASH